MHVSKKLSHTFFRGARSYLDLSMKYCIQIPRISKGGIDLSSYHGDMTNPFTNCFKTINKN